MSDLMAYAWPLARLGEAVALLARRAGYAPCDVEIPESPVGMDEAQIGRWLEATAVYFGVELQPTQTPYNEFNSFLETAVPAICQFPETESPCFLLLLKRRRNRLILLTPDGTETAVALTAVQAALCTHLEAPILAQIEPVLTTAGISSRRHKKATKAMLNQRLSTTFVGNCWLLELSPGSNFWYQMRQARVVRYLITFVGGHTVQYLLWLLSWAVLGSAIFSGRLEMGWMVAWALLLLTVVFIRLPVLWSQSVLAVTISGLLQKRLLLGALHLHPDEIRQEGVGELMGRSFEAEEMENLALNGGLTGVIAVIELALAVAILFMGISRWFHVSLLLIWAGFGVFLGYRYYHRRREWTVKRRDLTHDLIAQMNGHRTRQAQISPDHWHDGEDESLSHYVTVSAAQDNLAADLYVWIARGWLVMGVLGFAPAFVVGDVDTVLLAVALGGVLSAYFAFHKLTGAISQLTGAAIAWEQLSPLYHAAARPQATGDPSYSLKLKEPQTVHPILTTFNLHFRHQNQPRHLLNGCDLKVYQGDQILLEGPSGGGKSTLADLLTGLRQPQSGLILVDGLDLPTLGDDGWHTRIASAPQFYENHVFGSTFLFNLLLGSQWPPRREDWQRAETLCYELGLGSLLERMPAGLLQMVGETGWQLSHGEKSRLFVARALLQDSKIVLLDESFAALDPYNLQQAMACVQKQAKTLLVITHP